MRLRKKYKIIVVIIVGICVVVGFFGADIYTSVSTFKAKIYQKSRVEIYSDQYDESIYLKKHVWGIGGNHRECVITESSKMPFIPNEETDYIYKNIRPIFYKFNNDTLTIYTWEIVPIPPEFESKIVIQQFDMPYMIYNHYEEMGLTKF
jgi:hypothetical protein